MLGQLMGRQDLGRRGLNRVREMAKLSGDRGTDVGFGVLSWTRKRKTLPARFGTKCWACLKEKNEGLKESLMK